MAKSLTEFLAKPITKPRPFSPDAARAQLDYARTKRARRKTSFKRPFATHYYHGINDAIPSFSAQGACSKEENAIRATVVRLFMNGCAKALVIDRETGLALYTVRNSARGIEVVYGDRVHDTRPKLRAVA